MPAPAELHRLPSDHNQFTVPVCKNCTDPYTFPPKTHNTTSLVHRRSTDKNSASFHYHWLMPGVTPKQVGYQAIKSRYNLTFSGKEEDWSTQTLYRKNFLNDSRTITQHRCSVAYVRSIAMQKCSILITRYATMTKSTHKYFSPILCLHSLPTSDIRLCHAILPDPSQHILACLSMHT